VNIVFERTPALAALTHVVGIVENRHVIPILANVVLEAEGDRLTLTTSDINMLAVTSVPAHVQEAGSITIPAGKLHDIVKNADSGADVALATDAADTRVRVKSGRSNFKVPSLPADGFPKFSADGFSEGFAMPAKLLSDMLARVSWGVSRASNNVAIENLYLAHVDGLLHAVGCTNAGVALRREAAPKGSEDLKAIIPMKVVNQATKWLAEAEGDVSISCLNNNPGTGRPCDLLRLECGDRVLTSRLFDAPAFVNYPFILAEEHDLIARTDQDALKLAIRRVLVMRDAKSDTIRLTFTPGAIAIQMRNDQAGEGAEEIACEYDGPEAVLMVAARQLEDTIGSLKGDVVEVGFGPVALPMPAGNATPDVRAAYLRSIKVMVRAPSDPQYASTIAQVRA
jgi:DNA polymerase-3 subunit beta